MDKKDADMLAQSLMDEYDRRERDSKVVPSQSDLRRQSLANIRKSSKRLQNVNFSPLGTAASLISLVAVGAFAYGYRGIFALTMGMLFVIVFLTKYSVVSTAKKNKQKPDTSIFDYALIALVIFAIVIEGIMWLVY